MREFCYEIVISLISLLLISPLRLVFLFCIDVVNFEGTYHSRFMVVLSLVVFSRFGFLRKKAVSTIILLILL